MPRFGPRTVRRYSDEFKLTVVRLSQQPGIQGQTVAAALAIQPFMLSKWRKDVNHECLRTWCKIPGAPTIALSAYHDPARTGLTVVARCTLRPTYLLERFMRAPPGDGHRFSTSPWYHSGARSQCPWGRRIDLHPVQISAAALS
jgi:hypothetical protein